MTSSTPEPATSVMPTASSSDHAETGPRPALEPGAGLRLVCLPLAMLLALWWLTAEFTPYWLVVVAFLVSVLALLGVRKERRHCTDQGARNVLNGALAFSVAVVLTALLGVLAGPQPSNVGFFLLFFVAPFVAVFALASSVLVVVSLGKADGEFRRTRLSAVSALATALVVWTPLLASFAGFARIDGRVALLAAVVLVAVGLLTGIAAVIRGRGRRPVPAAHFRPVRRPASTEDPRQDAPEPYPTLAPGAGGRLVGLPLSMLLLLGAWAWTDAATWLTTAGLLLSILTIVVTVRERRHRVDPVAGVVVNSARVMAVGAGLLQLTFLLSHFGQSLNLAPLLPVFVLLGMASSVGTVLALRGPRGEYRRTRLGAISALMTSLVAWTPVVWAYVSLSGWDGRLAGWGGALLAAIGMVTGIVAMLQARTQRPLPEGSPTAAYGQDKNP